MAAEQARHIGLVHEIFPAETFLESVDAFCRELTATPAEALGVAKLTIDLAADVSQNINELKARRIDFVARYYRPPQSRWPALSPGEAQLLAAQGLKIVAVWEWHSRYPAHFTWVSRRPQAIMTILIESVPKQPECNPN